jgi:hypothetical protein
MTGPRLSPALFALAALSFLLPFGTVSCDTAKTSFTGVQLVTYTVPAGGAVSEGGDCTGDLGGCVEGEASWIAILALACALGGLIMGVRGRMRGPGWFAVGGFLAMLGLVGQAILSFADVRFEVGWRLGFGAFLVAMCVHGYAALKRRRAAVDASGLVPD